jgi:DNA polymerase III sliding clamp (beta) subunit (PCNA family)
VAPLPEVEKEMTAVSQEPETTEVIATILPAASLRNALSACLVAAQKTSDPKPLPVLQAVHIAKIGDQMVFRSTDRYRLVTVTIKLDNPPEGDWETLISVADAKRAVTALPNSSRRGEIATIAPEVIDVLTEGMALRFTPVDLDFPMTSHVVSTGSAPVEVIGLNPKFLADFAKLPGFQRNAPARLEFNGPNKPVVCNWTDDKDENVSYRYVLMAVRLP